MRRCVIYKMKMKMRNKVRAQLCRSMAERCVRRTWTRVEPAGWWEQTYDASPPVIRCRGNIEDRRSLTTIKGTAVMEGGAASKYRVLK